MGFLSYDRDIRERLRYGWGLRRRGYMFERMWVQRRRRYDVLLVIRTHLFLDFSRIGRIDADIKNL